MTQVINFLQQQPGWSSTLVIIAYDDSDGWYDHQMSPIVNPSKLTEGAAGEQRDGQLRQQRRTDSVVQRRLRQRHAVCLQHRLVQQGTPTPTAALAGYNGKANAQGRCGYGPRLPLLSDFGPTPRSIMLTIH